MSDESTQSPCRGSGDGMYTRGERAQHGKPDSVVGRDDQPGTGDGWTGRYGVAERFVVPLRPGNAGGGKGPWFKAGAGSGKAREIGATLLNSVDVWELRKAPQAEAKGEPGRWSREPRSPHVVALAVASNRADRSTLGYHGPGGWSDGCS